MLDTHVLLWAALGAARLPAFTRALLEDTTQQVSFSVVSLWEIVIKAGPDRRDFNVDPEAVRTYARLAGLGEVVVTGAHVLRVRSLQPLHNDPFDRLLVAQALEEGVELLTVDKAVLAYGEGVRSA
ncbi:type II toxin-antitoxin system VapC family toxin [Georgenia yuyongxinii]|uniref:Type II toxin-antitoxin system VapC family toxin n=1 Tax=Georgenia yuyongxinii TaxID=2589797 RepID=A0A5B8C7U8_9MICO|nr:type II toxin-antitoxin system VapC family toxin [Georgenia yuyongxinii]